mmetsp:Transcript_23147/g.46005  ORF Transcript_23147/g.46005 Transcript_23147/m.46005 type:complete len:125 (+) Transcript_23147:1184-1558(+)
MSTRTTTTAAAAAGSMASPLSSLSVSAECVAEAGKALAASPLEALLAVVAALLTAAATTTTNNNGDRNSKNGDKDDSNAQAVRSVLCAALGCQDTSGGGGGGVKGTVTTAKAACLTLSGWSTTC